MPTPPYTQRPDGSWVDATGQPVAAAAAQGAGYNAGYASTATADRLAASITPVKTTAGAGSMIAPAPAQPVQTAPAGVTVNKPLGGPAPPDGSQGTATGNRTGRKYYKGSDGVWRDEWGHTANSSTMSFDANGNVVEGSTTQQFNDTVDGAPTAAQGQFPTAGAAVAATQAGGGAAGPIGTSRGPAFTGGQPITPIKVDPSTIGGANLGPAVQVANAMVGQAPGVQGTTVGQAGNIQGNGFTAAQVAPVANVNATTIGPASVGAQERVAASMVTAPQIAPIERASAAAAGTTMLDKSEQGQLRDTQMRLVQSLEDQAAGRGGPSAAQIELAQRLEREKAQQVGAARATAGATNAGFAAKQAADAEMAIGQEGAGQLAALKAKERETALAGIGSAATAAREGDLSVATKQAEIQNQVALANAQLEQQARLANAGAQNTVGLEGAKMGLTAGLANQGTALDAAKANQGTTLASSVEQAKLAQGASVANQDTATRVALANQGTQLATATENAKLLQQSVQYKASTEFEAAKANQLMAQQTQIEQARINSDRMKQESAQKLAVLQQQADINAKKGIVDAQLATEIQKAQAELSQRTEEFNAKQIQEVGVKYSSDSLAAMTENERLRVTQQTEQLKAQLIREGYNLDALKAKMQFMLAQQGIDMQSEKQNDDLSMAYVGMLVNLYGDAFSLGGVMGG